MSKSKLNRVAKSWIAYDMGNSAFATTVLGAFFPLFFSSYWAGGMDEITITKNYTAGLTIINVIILNRSQTSCIPFFMIFLPIKKIILILKGRYQILIW